MPTGFKAAVLDAAALASSGSIQLITLDLSVLTGNPADVYHFCDSKAVDNGNIVFDGVEYQSIPIQMSGHKLDGSGRLPRPKLVISDVSGLFAAMLTVSDPAGARVTMQEVMLKFLDAVNYPDGINPDANPDMAFQPHIYKVDRVGNLDRATVTLELVSALELGKVPFPSRIIASSTCQSPYRGGVCLYAGPPIQAADESMFFSGSYNSTVWSSTITYPAGKAVWYADSTSYSLYESTGSTLNEIPPSTPGKWALRLKFRGTYDAVTTYAKNDWVFYTLNGRLTAHVCQADGTVGVAPLPAGSAWKMDHCARRLSSCRLRLWNNKELRFAGFPGAGKY